MQRRRKHSEYICCICFDVLQTAVSTADSVYPDQMALREQFDLGPKCLQYRVPK